MWDLPGPGLEPVSPALAGRFLTTVPPGKPSSPVLKGKQDLAKLMNVQGKEASGAKARQHESA